MEAELEAVVKTLRAMPSRSAQVILFRTVEGRSRESCAELYGVCLESYDALLARSLSDFEKTAGRPAPLELLTAQAEAIKALLAAAERADEASPARARETVLRRVAIVVILALTAFFYWQDQHRPRPAPEPRTQNGR